MKKEDQYTASLREIRIRLEKGGSIIADLGNTAAVLAKRLDFFWTGFYFLSGGRLVLGPFQGTPACVFLSLERGVCAEGVRRGETVIVGDVRDFPGHVACDPNSRSEIVVPLKDEAGRVFGVLDVDSAEKDCFDDTDRRGLEQVAALFSSRRPELPGCLCSV